MVNGMDIAVINDVIAALQEKSKGVEVSEHFSFVLIDREDQGSEMNTCIGPTCRRIVRNLVRSQDRRRNVKMVSSYDIHFRAFLQKCYVCGVYLNREISDFRPELDHFEMFPPEVITNDDAFKLLALFEAFRRDEEYDENVQLHKRVADFARRVITLLTNSSVSTGVVNGLQA
jgi:hypothetical protein